jgi:hypothetical protein
MGVNKTESTAEHKQGPAIRRQQLAERFLSGQWGVELVGVEQARQRERQRLQRRIRCDPSGRDASGL